MSEFVEESIEGLVPIFEVLKAVQLLSPTEVDSLIKRCKSFEYRLQKARKDVHSFKVYTDYLESVLKIIRMRRKRLKYRLREEEIEGNIKNKIANLYRQCCERFPGRKEMWLERVDFLKREKMHVRCSRAYFRALQIFPSDVWLRIQAARYEYSVEHKVDCARCIMHEGIRLNPSDNNLWVCFVQLELDYVKWLATRRSILTGKGYRFPNIEEREIKVAEEAQKSSEVQIDIDGKSEKDAVLGLRVVEMIIKQALEHCVSNKSEMLLGMWRTAKRYGLVAEHLTKKLYDMLWTPKYRSEESWIAKSESCNYDQESLYELLDKACEDRPSEKMYRHYLGVCKRHYSFDRDPDAKAKCHDLLFWLITKGYGTDADIAKFDHLVENTEEKEKILTERLQISPSNAFLWLMLMRCKIRSTPENVEEIRKLFSKAIKEVFDESSGIAEMYKLAIDWSIKYSPEDVDDFFAKATFRTPPRIACEMRCLHLQYLVSAYPKNPEIRREEYFRYVKHPPNSMEVHRTFIRSELNSDYFLLDFLLRALESMVSEFGNQTHECWILYAECLLRFEPTALQAIHRRAMAALPAYEVELFLMNYGNLMQRATEFRDSDGDNDDEDDDDDEEGDDLMNN